MGPEGGRWLGRRQWARLYNRGGNHLGDRLSEAGIGFESCSMLTDQGELLEVTVTDDEVVVGVNDTISAAYDRVGGFLTSASFSLTAGVIDSYSRGILDLPDELFEMAVELKIKGDDLVIVVEFDDDGEAKVFLVRTENGETVQLISIIRHDEMVAAFGVIEGEEDEGEGDEPLDFVVEGEEDLVGEFLSGWRQPCPIFDLSAEFAVGIRTQVVDFSIIDVENDEAMPYHASQLFDPSRLDNTRLTAKMVRSFAGQAFPEMGWDNDL
ncbi:hypothetical protein A3D09_03580 [Candidatus Collierbacteria bacterium RIFCSPHIGHO2_02_FULL_49_10]|uniref:Uncharacterized protein n=1 Tax=Candidatus Collierbacteria bacterium RIFCSPHIGHO2_02_FULL_49_10 TaxID=1817723 RepID=A0A1F5EV09_9BACT|nr:MAG: hypothetical protein A3D09_03580 [Candidatus Collierbacteria bacterium RIFCSPHIGHO2_02_FULL_49_10]